MIISHQKKLIFIHVHRTGGTSFGNLLYQALPDWVEISPQHSNAMSIEADFFDAYADYFTFGFTRNPWERLLSWYALIFMQDPKSLTEERKRFETFLEEDQAADFSSHEFHYNSLDYFSTKKGEFVANKLLRFERLQEEVSKLSQQMNLDLNHLEKVNTSRSKNYRDFYTAKSREQIAQKCQKDIEYFNYSF